MPTPSTMALDKFIQNYNNYMSASAYSMQWTQAVASLARLLQADPNFLTALSAQEQTAVQANLTAAQAVQIAPVLDIDKLI